MNQIISKCNKNLAVSLFTAVITVSTSHAQPYQGSTDVVSGAAGTQNEQVLLFCNAEGQCGYKTYNVYAQAAVLAILLRSLTRNADRQESAEQASLAKNIRNLENVIRNAEPSDVHKAMAATFDPAVALNKIMQDELDVNKKEKHASIWKDIKAQFILAAQANAKEEAGWDYGWDGYEAAKKVRKEEYRKYLNKVFKKR
jgi:hypothetical protein